MEPVIRAPFFKPRPATSLPFCNRTPTQQPSCHRNRSIQFVAQLICEAEGDHREVSIRKEQTMDNDNQIAPDTAIAPAEQQQNAPRKNHSRLIVCITAVVIAVVAIGGILFADILTSTPSSPAKWVSSSSKTKSKSTSSSHSGPWYVDTWYGIGVTTTGVNDMDLDDAHVKAAMQTTLVLDPAGTAELNVNGSYDSTSFTGTWVEDKDSDRDAVTLFLKESGTNDVSRFTLVCDDPEDEGSASCLVLYTNTDLVFAFCRDKKVAESSTWSTSDLPSLDGLS